LERATQLSDLDDDDSATALALVDALIRILDNVDGDGGAGGESSEFSDGGNAGPSIAAICTALRDAAGNQATLIEINDTWAIFELDGALYRMSYLPKEEPMSKDTTPADATSSEPDLTTLAPEVATYISGLRDQIAAVTKARDEAVAAARIEQAEREVSEIASINGWQHLLTVDHHKDNPALCDLWVEFADTTCNGDCPNDPGHRTWPAWEWIERGEVIGYHGGQCGNCGVRGSGWVQSGAVRLVTLAANPADNVTGTEVELIAQRFGEHLDDELTEANRALERELRRGSEEAMYAIRHDAFMGADITPGNENRPGTFLDGDRLITWDYSPSGIGVIEASVVLSEAEVAAWTEWYD
jgi:hypothetical protein